jgi:subtilase family serine protease
MFRFALAAGLSTVLAISAVASVSMAQVVERSGRSFHVQACAAPNVAGMARCHAHIVTDSTGRLLPMLARFRGVRPSASAAVSGGPYWASQIRAAYGITGTGAPGTVVAIVDAYGYPNAASDLATYRSSTTDNGISLPALASCASFPAATPCLRIVNETGGANLPRSNAGWDEEQALDLDMVSAMCPNCSILLVEASSASYRDLGAAENTAARLGALSIGNSYGGGEAGTTSYNTYYTHPGVNITASAGDSGYGVAFPASSPNVIAVGGTSLVYGSGPRAETVWSGSGSGCSAVYAQPSWQQSSNSNMANNTGCSRRVMNDVSAVADPDTGVVVYMNIRPYSPGYYIFGGTSVSAQIISGIYGERGLAAPSTPTLYTIPFPYGASGVPAVLNDVTSGSDGRCSPAYFCTAEAGYDGPTGLGTPIGDSAF